MVTNFCLPTGFKSFESLLARQVPSGAPSRGSRLASASKLTDDARTVIGVKEGHVMKVFLAGAAGAILAARLAATATTRFEQGGRATSRAEL